MREPVHEYERPVPGTKSQDVCCAWIVFAAAVLGMFVVSLVHA